MQIDTNDYTRFCYMKIRFKWSKSYEITRLNFQKISVFIGQKSIFRRYCIQNVKDGTQIQVYNIDNESVTQFSQLIPAKVKIKFKKISGSISGQV